MSAPRLSAEGLCKSFGSLVVTDDVSLRVQSGEFHALIGPNGAGKTTLINQLSGSLKSGQGRVVFDGTDVTGLGLPGRARRGLARSFQITSILPGFSVLANAAIAVQARSGSSFRFFAPAAEEAGLNAQAMTALERVGLPDRASQRAGSLSHGERRLLELAIALASSPKLLLLDEPLAGLGRQESLAAIEMLARLKSELTIVLVEHDMDAVFALADRISVLAGGRIIASGTPAEIRADAAVRTAYLGEAEAA